MFKPMSDTDELIKRRELRFCHLHPDPDQGRSALMLLSDAEGVIDITLADELCLYITYDVRYLTLDTIEKVLIRLGYHLDGRLLHRMKRALYHYAEETQRANLGVSDTTDSTTQVFVKRYSCNHHGCRDKRPEHWRKYL
ncbi:hypothetical protein MNBD_GAMMA11-999 [hydrothermal vent metagenome]|uniref:Uncharacterized protein n=1 Tax=hydrothermal vent metagenome TaxID=652676 RepID=A0A3B0WY85_9ZZZZ